MIRAAAKLRGPQLYTETDIAALSGAAFHARRVLDGLLRMVGVGVTPQDIERRCRNQVVSVGAQPIMAGVTSARGEPFGHACSVSVDDAVTHARPGEATLGRGQLVTIDLMLAIDGWHADVADSAVVGGGGHPLLDAMDAVWNAGLAAVRPGGTWSEVALAMNAAAEARRVRMVRGLAGHGIGLAPHELPALPLTPLPIDPPIILRPGMIFTLEPAITSGSGQTVDSDDGWTIRTADGAPAVGREAMIAMSEDGFCVLGGRVLDRSVDDSAVAAGYNPFRTGLRPGRCRLA